MTAMMTGIMALDAWTMWRQAAFVPGSSNHRAPSDKDAYEKAEDVCLEDGQWRQARLSADNRDERGMIRGYGEI